MTDILDAIDSVIDATTGRCATADIVVVFGLGSGKLATRLRGDAQLSYSHEHRPGGAAPSGDTIRLALEMRDAVGAERRRVEFEPPAGRHRLDPIESEAA